jgi:hypothetical protein
MTKQAKQVKQANQELKAALRELEQAQQAWKSNDSATTDALLAAQLRVEEAQAKVARSEE